MSDFSESWVACMHGNGLPVPDLDDLDEALEFVHKIHSAWENAGAGEELTIGALIVAGAFVGVDEAVLAALGEAAAALATAYLAACIGCMAAVALDDLKDLFAEGELPDFVVAELENQGIDVANA